MERADKTEFEQDPFYWERLEKLAAEIPDDDPRIANCYVRGVDLDNYTLDVLRAKNLLKARDNNRMLLGLLMAIQQKKEEGNNE